jgi:hypothetical protein
MKLVIKYRDADGTDRHVNIDADRMEEGNGLIRAYDGGILVAVFDAGYINLAYLSGREPK